MDSGVTVTGGGQASAPADLVRLMLSVGCDANGVSAAVDAVAARTDAVLAALRERGLEGNDVRTTGVNVHPSYGLDGMPARGYRASHSLTVSTSDLRGFGALLDAAVAAAGNDLGVDQLSFDVADKTALLEQARHSAFADARTRAEHLAELAGRQLGTIESVTEGGGYGPPMPMFERNLAASAELALAPGEQVTETSVTVRWAWA